MNKNFNLDGMGALGIIVGLAGILFAGWQAKKTSDITKKLGVSMDEVEKKTDVEIQQSIVDQAVEKAVDREVKLAVADTAGKVRDDIRSDIASRVKEAVNDSMNVIDSAVEAKAQELVNGIDKEQFGKRIENEGARILTKDFSGRLDGMLAEAKSKISYMTNTISGLAEAFLPIRKSGSSGLNFHID